jgi:hypothetical protein
LIKKIDEFSAPCTAAAHAIAAINASEVRVASRVEIAGIGIGRLADWPAGCDEVRWSEISAFSGVFDFIDYSRVAA